MKKSIIYFVIGFACGALVAKEELWAKLSIANGGIEAKKGNFQTGFLGLLPCRKAKIDTLKIGGMTVKDADVIVLDNDSPYLRGAGYVSMKFFKERIVVLDFKRMVMWVK